MTILTLEQECVDVLAANEVFPYRCLSSRCMLSTIPPSYDDHLNPTSIGLVAIVCYYAAPTG